MKRLIEKIVLVGLVTACRFATVPTRRSPPAVNATTDGVVRPPSAFSMTVGSPPSRTAMHEFVVPRSMPMVLPMWGVSPLEVLAYDGKNLSQTVADRFSRDAELPPRAAVFFMFARHVRAQRSFTGGPAGPHHRRRPRDRCCTGRAIAPTGRPRRRRRARGG